MKILNIGSFPSCFLNVFIKHYTFGFEIILPQRLSRYSSPGVPRALLISNAFQRIIIYTCMHIIPCVSFISIFIYSYLRVFTYIFSSFFRWFFKLLFINFPLHGQWCPPWCSFSARPSVRFWLFPRMTKQCPSAYHKQDLQRKKR